MDQQQTKSSLSSTNIPLCRTKSGPRDEEWTKRLREELLALIACVEANKKQDNHFFDIKPSDASGTKWSGKCWHYYKHQKYSFELKFDIPVTYPTSPPQIMLPELDGLSEKMFRGGIICTETHFEPLWRSNSPSLSIAHALSLALGPWLSVEIPTLVEQGLIKPDEVKK